MDFLDGDIQVDSVPDSQTGQGSEVPQAPEAQKASHVVQLSDQEHHQHAGSITTVHKTSRLSHKRLGVETSMTRPTTMAEIRESLSFLVDEPLVLDSQRSESEDEDNDTMDIDARGSREVLHSVHASVVNRLSTMRTEEENADGPMAFQAPASTSTSGFKVPSLLRRATNLSSTSNSSSGVSTSSTESKVRMGGSRKSNIHYQAREAERKKIVEAADRKRKEEVEKSVLGKGRRSALGVLGSYSSGFE
jgi:mediator of replication checkpoint protein 1